MDPCKFGWSKDELTKSLVPISVPSDVPAAPNDIHNPNTFTGVVEKVRKIPPEGGRKGGWRKKALAARQRLETRDLSCASVAIDRVGRLRNTTCRVFWR